MVVRIKGVYSLSTKNNIKHRAGNRRHPPVKCIGTPANYQTKLDQYLAKAQAWSAAGDTVEAENCYQHAEHYLRMLQNSAALG